MTVAPAKSRETISAVIMTKNSEKLVRGTLESVKPWADEIIVLDGYSTDRTLEVCRHYTEKIYQNRWDGYRFCTERNLGTSKATSDWCLHIDPDERATTEFRDKVMSVLKKGTPHNAFEFHKKNYFLGKWMRHGGWYHYSLHLFRRGKAVYEGVIHETLKVDGSIGKIQAAVEHHPFTSFSQFVQRHNGYSTREAMAKVEAGEVPGEREIWFQVTKKPLKRFFKFYVKKRGFQDGIHGLFFSILFAWVHFINWAKTWELKKRQDPASL